MSEIRLYAPSVLEVNEEHLVTGGWLRQLHRNRNLAYESAIKVGRMYGDRPRNFDDLSRARHYFRFARDVNKGVYDRGEVMATAKAVQLSPALRMEDVERPDLREYDYVTGVGLTGSAALFLLSGTTEKRYTVRRGLLRRQSVVARQVAHYAVASLQLPAGAMYLYDSELFEPLDFARYLEPLVYAAQPRYQDGIMTIGRHEVLRTALPEG